MTTISTDTAPDMVRVAREAGLRYVNDGMRGITRVRSGRGFRYLGADGRAIKDARQLARIRGLGIPPAWQQVWIAPSPNAHIQATGRDSKGRKQYRYHPRWRETRDETKYGRMVAFGEALPLIRARVRKDLGHVGLPRDRVLATIVALLDMTHIRIGNREYAEENETYGLTTLHNEHVEVSASRIHLQFRGKAGKDHAITVRDRRLARIIERCQDLPGQELFQYLDEDGEPHPISSDDVNEYLHAIAGEDFTAKDFRTWAGTLVAACALREAGHAESEADARRQIVAAVKRAAAHLGNTPAICRKSYVHPSVIDAYMDGSLLVAPEDGDAIAGDSLGTSLRPEEVDVLAFLRRLPLPRTTDRAPAAGHGRVEHRELASRRSSGAA